MAGPGPGGASSALGLDAATLVNGTADTDTSGFVFIVSVLTAGSAVGSIYDSNTTSGNTAANQIGTIPNEIGTYLFGGFPYSTGLVYVPGTDQVASISYTQT